MVEIGPTTWISLIKRLRQLGLEGPFQGGKHPYMVKSALVLTIPNQHHKEISIDLLSRILNKPVYPKKSGSPGVSKPMLIEMNALFTILDFELKIPN